MVTLTAEAFIQALQSKQSDAEKNKMGKFFKGNDPKNEIIGVRFKDTFDLAEVHTDMPIGEITKLLDSPYYEARMGAVSIMDFQARSKKITEPERKALFDLYLSKHNRINNWDLVDRSAPRVLGWYLMDKPRDVLYKLAKSKDPNERRSAIVATLYFSMQGEPDETFKVAAALGNDSDELVNKAIGTALRYAGKKDSSKQLASFLAAHGDTLAPLTVRLAKG